MKSKHRVRRNVKKTAPQTQGGQVNGLIVMRVDQATHTNSIVFGSFVVVDPVTGIASLTGATGGAEIEKPTSAVKVLSNGTEIGVADFYQIDGQWQLQMESESIVVGAVIEAMFQPWKIHVTGGIVGVNAGGDGVVIAVA